MSLNFKHLRYFRAVAQTGNLTRAAEKMHVSQSALSVQIKKLEDWLGQDLFLRQGKRLVLTEAGHMALDYADTIFDVGEELVTTLKHQDGVTKRVVRIGALATLSRNFQTRFLHPLFEDEDVLVVVRSGTQDKLLHDLETHNIDVMLTNNAPVRDSASEWLVHSIAEQRVSLIGDPSIGSVNNGQGTGYLEQLLAEHPLIVPTMENSIRTGFDSLCERLGVRPKLRAEVDDMALIRLLVKTGIGLAVIPPIVVRDELSSGALRELTPIPDLRETFVAITVARQFPNPLLPEIIKAAKEHIEISTDG